MNRYQSLNEQHIQALQNIVGVEHTLTDNAIGLEYAQDAATKKSQPFQPYYPKIVILPKTATEISRIVKFANAEKIPIVPRGGGSGLAGGSVPIYGGILLDLGRMNRILQVDKDAQYIVVEPGVRTIDLQQAACRENLLYAGDPCSNDSCVIGGNIATNAGGNRAVKYGVTGDQVYELEVVTPQGEIVKLGGRLKKNATGYNLLRLLIGSEGTLGIITQATLKLQPLAPYITNYIAVSPDLKTTAALVNTLVSDAVIHPLSLELIDVQTAREIEKYQGNDVFHRPVGDCLIIQWESQSKQELTGQKDRLVRITKENGCLQLEEAAGDLIWPARRIWGQAIDKENPVSVADDLVVPVDQITNFILALKQSTETWQMQFRLAGHAGDGNMHIRLLPGLISQEKWQELLPEFRQQFYQKTYQLGGRLSGEHGIGFKRKNFLKELADPNELLLMKAIKQAMDPNLILNPGKIFDVD